MQNIHLNDASVRSHCQVWVLSRVETDNHRDTKDNANSTDYKQPPHN